jgi:FlaA1/EpsC-like NDP-sugar epimerase
LIKSILRKLVEFSRFKKQLIMLFLDSFILISALLISFSIRLGYWYWPENDLILILIFSSPIIAIPLFFVFGIYQSILRYIGFKSLWSILQAVSFYALAWGISGFMIMGTDQGIPRSIIIINWLLVLIAIVGVRIFARLIFNNNSSIDAKNVVIYGAGSAGRQLSNALLESNEYKIVGFIDDNSALEGQSINEIKVFNVSKLDKLIKKNNIKEILLAIPSSSQNRRNKIIEFLKSFPLIVRSLPGVTELAQGKVSVNDLRVININDLLGRNSVVPNKQLMSLNVKDKVVMITGAGGSIGSELCRQILFLNPKVIVMYEMSEFALYEIDRELSGLTNEHLIELIPILGSVTDNQRLINVFNKYGVETVYHAAAYKHVPLVEFNNSEGVENNIFGTLNCAQSAIDSNVETFVLISTDKAVRPTNTMGATKRFSEMILQALSFENTNTRFTMVRFGNVLGSSGSVIPKFSKQIKNGGPITITDKEMIRYFMTIPEAVELVIQAGSMGKGGDVFVLDMGKPVKILDLALKMIHLSGLQIKNDLNPDGDIEIEFTGIRPGEKLYEELIIGNNISKTDNPMIMRAKENSLEWNELNRIIGLLKNAIRQNECLKMRALLIEAIPEFKPNEDISDLLFSEKVKK